MNIAIDLGNTYSFLICWDNTRSVTDAYIKVKVQGINPSATHDNSCWDAQALHEYLFHLYREYILPSRLVVESAALSVPDILDLNHRRILLDIMEEMLGLAEVSILPRPIALLCGYQLHNPQFPADGDVMIIHLHEKKADLSLLSITETGGITLENYFPAVLPLPFNEAILNDFYSPQEWNWDLVLLTADKSNFLPVENWWASLVPNTNIVVADNLQFAAAEGLYAIGQKSLIYPYEFYLQKYDRHEYSNDILKIPFDTANLELDCSGLYHIFNLRSSTLSYPDHGENRIRFRIYELAPRTGDGIPALPVAAKPVLEVDSLSCDLPEHLEIALDMRAAYLYLDLKTEQPNKNKISIKNFRDQLTVERNNLYELIASKQVNQNLTEDYNNHFLSADRDCQNPLAFELNATLFHLYGLMQLWQEK